MNNKLDNLLEIKSFYKDIVVYANKNSISDVKNIEISGQIHNLLPTVIDENGFKDCYNLENVSLGKQINSIFSSAFSGCKNLRTVSMTDSVTYIEAFSFENCFSLDNINLSNNISTIAKSCFYKCTNLKNILLPDNIKEIGEYAFDGCNSLNDIILPPMIKKINRFTFSDCKKLSNVELNDGLQKICGFAFNGCENLKVVKIPKSVSLIDTNCFRNCYSLNDIYIPKDCNFDADSFLNCDNVTVHYKGTLKDFNIHCKNIDDRNIHLKIILEEEIKKIEQLISQNISKNEFEKEIIKLNDDSKAQLHENIQNKISNNCDINAKLKLINYINIIENNSVAQEKSNLNYILNESVR